MLREIFTAVLRMSVTGSFVIAAVMLARLCLKRAPRTVSYCLWAVALFRLCCPVSFESVFSLLPRMARTEQSLPVIPGGWTPPAVTQPLPPVEAPILPVSPAAAPQGTLAAGRLDIMTILAIIWLAVGAVMLGGSVILSIRLHRKLRHAKLSQDNIYEQPGLQTPFVLGLVKPRIYLPTGLSERERAYVLLHEQTHIRRRDYLVKALANLVLCIHWFNPFVWLAFKLMTSDMEMSCDEQVLKKLGPEIKREYSASLLSMAAGKRVWYTGPLAFGEENIKMRIKNVLNYKKPAFWLTAVTVAAAAALALGLAANPKAAAGTPEESSGASFQQGESLRRMSIEDIRALAQKGKALSWDDLADFEGSDIGSGLYVMQYPLAESGWALTAGGGSMEGAPEYARLTSPFGGELDILEGDLEAFLAEQNNAFYPEKTSFSADLTHDGAMETITCDFTELEDGNGNVNLTVTNAAGETLWSDFASTSHAGWLSFSLCKVDGSDYILRYSPSVYQGAAEYGYQLFSLNEKGEMQTADEASVFFAMTAGPYGLEFEPEEISEFVTKLNNHLLDSFLLCGSLDGQITFSREGQKAAQFEYMDWLKGKTSLDENAPLLDQLRAYKTEVLEPEFLSYERQIMVDKIQGGIGYADGNFTVTIPEDAIPGTFNVTVSGRLTSGGGMSWHAFQDVSDGANWVPGETYSAPLDPADTDSIEAAIYVLQTDGSTIGRTVTFVPDGEGGLMMESWEDEVVPPDTVYTASKDLPVSVRLITAHISRMLPEEMQTEIIPETVTLFPHWNDEDNGEQNDHYLMMLAAAEIGSRNGCNPVPSGAMMEVTFGSFVPAELTVRWEGEGGIEKMLTPGKNGLTLLSGEKGERGLCRITARWENGNEAQILLPIEYDAF